jgi:hypothetical protein
MTKPSAHEGGCLCGAVRYRFSATPRVTSLCHCRSCRRAAGAPSVAWVILDAAALEFTAGAPTPHRSSPAVTRQFCGRCGTPLTYQNDASPGSIDITTASLDDPDAFPPSREIWLDHKIAWETLNPSLPHYAKSSKNALPL